MLEETQSKATPATVSVVVRTVGRPELAEALKSVAEQSYPQIEVLVVDAAGDGVPSLGSQSNLPNYRLITDGKQHDRASAGNLGLESCAGDYILFLDDDDWIGSNHLQSLVCEIQARPEAIAVYSSTQKTLKDGSLIPEFFAEEFSSAVLRRDNFMPIHSVLFSRKALEQGCRLDPALEIYEDWDFWLQLNELGEFFHIDIVSAFYRGGGDSETPVAAIAEKYSPDSANAQARAKVLDKWTRRWSGEQLNSTLGSLDRTQEIIDQQHALETTQSNFSAQLQKHHEERKTLVKDYEEKIATELARLESLLNEKEERERQIIALEAEHDSLQSHFKLVTHSLSWRITKPLRFSGRLLRAAFSRLRSFDSTASSFLETQTPSAIKYSLDTPSAVPNLIDGDLTLEGWAFSAAGPVTITVRINEFAYCTIKPSLARTDVGAVFPNIVSAGTSGFRTTLIGDFLPNGKLTITLELSDGESSQLIRRTAVKLAPAQLYELWLKEKAPFSPAQSSTAGNTTLLSLSHIKPLQLNTDELVDSFLGALREAGRTSKNLILIADGEHLRTDAVKLLANAATDAELVYSDHDKFDAQGMHCLPEFTFGWSPEHLMGRNFVGGVFLFSSDLFARCDTPALRESLRRVLTDQPDSFTAVRYYLLLAMGAQARSVARVAEVLWSEPLQPAASSYEYEKLWLDEFIRLAEPHSTADAAGSEDLPVRAINRRLTTRPLVSIIIPTMAKLSLIKPCLETLQTLTSYTHFEVIILDNSRGKYPEGIEYLRQQPVQLVECDFDFNWPQLNNVGVAHSKGEYLLFLNDDIEITEPLWLSELLKQAQRPEVGAVGPMLYYPENKIQHAGVRLVNQGGGAMHLFHKLAPSNSLHGQLHRIAREVTANTGACLLLSREKFEEVGGFDETLRVVGNDIDLCLKLLSCGYVNIWTPRSALIHHESISRKATEHPEDEATMWQRWGQHFIAGDRYYNPNLGMLSADCAPDLALRKTEQLEAIPLANFTAAESSSEEGVNLIGYIRAEMGLGEGARSDARALQAAELDFGIINYELGNSARMGELSWQHKERTDAPFDVTLWHINADHLAAAQHSIPAYLVQESYQIAFWAWELETMPSNWRPSLALVDEIWVPSEFVRKAIASETDKPVINVPHCVAPQPDVKLDRDYFGLPQEGFLFLAMYDTNSVAERKNPKAALLAYLEAFPTAETKTSLVLKVNNSTADSLFALNTLVDGRDDIILLTANRNKREIDSLINACDCFVSLHRSEGFGLAPAEAMALGKAVILSDWSGSQEYTDANHCLPIRCELIELDRDYGPYEQGQRWADPDISRAAHSMQQLVAQPTLATELGGRAKVFIDENFSPQAIGLRMKNRLKEIRGTKDEALLARSS